MQRTRRWQRLTFTLLSWVFTVADECSPRCCSAGRCCSSPSPFLDRTSRHSARRSPHPAWPPSACLRHRASRAGPAPHQPSPVRREHLGQESLRCRRLHPNLCHQSLQSQRLLDLSPSRPPASRRSSALSRSLSSLSRARVSRLSPNLPLPEMVKPSRAPSPHPNAQRFVRASSRSSNSSRRCEATCSSSSTSRHQTGSSTFG